MEGGADGAARPTVWRDEREGKVRGWTTRLGKSGHFKLGDDTPTKLDRVNMITVLWRSSLGMEEP
jgi:hypothetical protein